MYVYIYIHLIKYLLSIGERAYADLSFNSIETHPVALGDSHFITYVTNRP